MRLGLTGIMRGKAYGKIRLKRGLKVPVGKGTSRLIICHGDLQALDLFMEVNGFFVLSLKIEIFIIILK